MRVIALVVGLGVLLAGCGGGTPSADPTPTSDPPTSAVECGLNTYEDGHQVVRYCGDGSATVRLAGAEPVRVDGAECRRRGAFVTANLGTNYSNPDAARGAYVGLLLKASEPATVTGIELTLDGGRIAVSEASAKVRLSDSALDTTVTGSADGKEVEIALHCALA
jgi:hypothetical protein